MKEITPDKEDKIKSDHGDKNVKSKKTKKEGFLSKVIIRKLPPNMTEEEFIKSIDPIPDHDYLYFVPVDWTLGTEATSRAYIHFLNPEDIFIFKDKFDGYVFVDSMRGTEYPAIVEFAPFQGLPKSRGRKKDKNANTIEEEPHYINFLESLKTEEADGQKPEPKLEYSYQIKDDKKITSTPLLEFIANKYQEKRDQKRKKNDDRKKNRDDEKQKKKIQIAKHIPESIKEEIVYDDGVVIRTVPRMERRDNRNKNEKKNDNTTDKDKDKERGGKNREKDKERQSERRKLNREREKERKSEQREQKAKQKLVNDEKNPDVPKVPTEAPAKTAIVEKDRPVVVDTTNKDDVPAKKEIKRYSQQRKERYGNEPKSTEITQSSNVEKDSIAIQEKPVEQKQEKAGEKEHRSHRNSEKTPRTPQEEAEKSELSEKRLKRVQEQKERRAREADERAQRRIKNKDRPAIQIYQPKRRGPGTSSTGKADNSKSSDESCASNKKAEPERKVTEEKREPEKKPSRKNSREESSRKNSREEPIRKNSREEPIRKNSREEPIRKNSRDESHRKKLPTGSRKNSFESQKSLESNEGKDKIMKQSNGGDIRQVPVKVFPNDTIPVKEEHDLIPMKIIGHTENDGSIFPNQLIIDAPAVPKEPQMLNLNLIS